MWSALKVLSVWLTTAPFGAYVNLLSTSAPEAKASVPTTVADVVMVRTSF